MSLILDPKKGFLYVPKIRERLLQIFAIFNAMIRLRLTDEPDALNVSVSSSTEMAIGCASPPLAPPAENEPEDGEGGH